MILWTAGRGPRQARFWLRGGKEALACAAIPLWSLRTFVAQALLPVLVGPDEPGFGVSGWRHNTQKTYFGSISIPCIVGPYFRDIWISHSVSHKSQNSLLSETPRPLANICITSRHGSFLAFSTSEMYDSRTPTLSASSPCSIFFSRRSSRTLAPKRLRNSVDTP